MNGAAGRVPATVFAQGFPQKLWVLAYRLGVAIIATGSPSEIGGVATT